MQKLSWDAHQWNHVIKSVNKIHSAVLSLPKNTGLMIEVEDHRKVGSIKKEVREVKKALVAVIVKHLVKRIVRHIRTNARDLGRVGLAPVRILLPEDPTMSALQDVGRKKNVPRTVRQIPLRVPDLIKVSSSNHNFPHLDPQERMHPNGVIKHPDVHGQERVALVKIRHNHFLKEVLLIHNSLHHLRNNPHRLRVTIRHHPAPLHILLMKVTRLVVILVSLRWS